jgi:predicted Zn-dependent peptidase
MTRLGASELASLPLLTVSELIERIDAVGLPELRELTAEIFQPERLSLAGVGPDAERFRQATEPLVAQAGPALRGAA